MTTSSQFQRRKFIRLRGYDYTSEGGYFVTIITHKRTPLFGRIVNGAIHLTPEGEIARKEWFRTMELRDNIELFEDEFVVMPNHIHGIIWITGVHVEVEPHLSVGSSDARPLLDRL